jgi:leucyl-tRNA synthetase
MMVFINACYKEDSINEEYAKGFIKLLNPICPHITEEIWETVFGNTNTIAYEAWPTYDESKIKDDEFEMVVQVNGKVRGKITVSSNTTEDEMKELAMNIENVKTYVEGKEIVKVITIPKKLVSIVIK